MNIDLLFTKEGEAGLVCAGNLIKKAAGALLDTSGGLLTLEYVDMDFTEMNIPVDSAFFPMLDMCARIHIGAVQDGQISQAYQIPLMFLDDPYRGQSLGMSPDSAKPLQAFEHFIRRCVAGQPVSRMDLGDEDSMGCVLGDSSPASLDFAPHLARRHAQELSVGPRHVPGYAGPGLGGGGGSAARGKVRGTKSDEGKKSGD
ncbi:MAG: hypothetical protein K9G62_09015 [Alphaproteobacteria bacterium]|nr:hypothetical protein [Alphaproteobacteria bacterium]